MEDLRKIIWLASYPKSGNTWLRVFLTCLLRPDEEMDINNLAGGPIASSREVFDEISGLSSSDLTREEIENLRPDVYIHLAKMSKGILYRKIHDAYIATASGRPLIPAEVSKSVVYVIRNPLDVAASFANHLNKALDETIALMGKTSYAFCSKDHLMHNQLEQKLLTWSEHVESWLDLSNLPVHILKYEDMIYNSFETFKQAAQFLGFKKSDEEIQKAIRQSEFNQLHQQEKEKGFKEKAPDSPAFFRQGKEGTWKDELSKEQADLIIHQHKKVMERFGYYPI